MIRRRMHALELKDKDRRDNGGISSAMSLTLAQTESENSQLKKALESSIDSLRNENATVSTPDCSFFTVYLTRA